MTQNQMQRWQRTALLCAFGELYRLHGGMDGLCPDVMPRGTFFRWQRAYVDQFGCKPDGSTTMRRGKDLRARRRPVTL